MTIGILSWKAHDTLINTLNSYKELGLNELDDDKIIYFQEITDEEKGIAKAYGYRAIGTEENVGIAQGFSTLVEEAKGDLFLFLENDWQLIEEPNDQIADAGDLLTIQVIDVARFRHRQRPGAPLWSQQFIGRELTRPEYLLESLHWTERPERLFPQIHVTQSRGDWYTTTAPYAAWTNNPFMARTEWLKEHILPRAAGDIEINLQNWWLAQKDFIVAQSEGLFTHNRLDR